MKKLQIVLIAGILTITPFTFTEAQNGHAGLSKTSLMLASISRVGELTNVLKKVDRAGFKAMKDFTSSFKDASNVKWFAGDNIISASFIKDGIKNSVLYDKNGNYIRNIKNYDESKMPADIRELVKRSEYFDNNIVQAFEIQERNLLYYIVYMEDKKTFNQVVVNDGEITLFKTFKKE